jgi:ATP-dependent DNA ligase
MDPDWIPIRPRLVCEVAYDTLDGRRMRYPARFARWRPDREARSCRFDQLEDATPDLRELLSS